MRYDLIIIGGGPAGLTAALYAGRFRLNTLLLEKMSLGGQIIMSERIENYPGFPGGGIATFELMDKIKQQVDALDVGIVLEEVRQIAVPGDFFKVSTSENSYEARSIIIASGSRAKQLGIKGETLLSGRGVSYCATCDAPLFKNKEVVVVGGGDKAIEEALFLSSYCQKVSIVHRRQGFRAAGILLEKARSNSKIEFVLDSVVEEIEGANKVEAVRVKNIVTQMTSRQSCQGVFIFVGIEPNTEYIKNLLQLSPTGFIIADQAMQSSQEGIFACGDCLEKSLYQVVNACGEGAVAADSAHKYLLMKRQ